MKNFALFLSVLFIHLFLANGEPGEQSTHSQVSLIGVFGTDRAVRLLPTARMHSNCRLWFESNLNLNLFFGSNGS